MGEYYRWFNVDKMEQLEPGPFDTGVKMASNVDVGNEYTDAVCTLLDSDWKGDGVVFLGDYRRLDNEENPVLAKLEEDCGHREPCAFDEAEEIYTEIAGRFALAKGKTHYDFESDDMRKVPYEGALDKELIHFRYVINDTKKQFYDRQRTAVTAPFAWRSGIPESGIMRLDPLPVLLGAGEGSYGDAYLVDNVTVPIPDGMWIGDKIRLSHEAPQAGYDDISAMYHIFYRPLITEPDEEILPILESDEFRDAMTGNDVDERNECALELLRMALDGVSLVGFDCLEELLSRIPKTGSAFVENVAKSVAYGGKVDNLIVFLADRRRSASDVCAWLESELGFPALTVPSGERYIFLYTTGRRHVVRMSDGEEVGGSVMKRYQGNSSYVGVWHSSDERDKDAAEPEEIRSIYAVLLELLEKDARADGIDRLFTYVSPYRRIRDDDEFYRLHGFTEFDFRCDPTLVMALGEYGSGDRGFEKRL